MKRVILRYLIAALKWFFTRLSPSVVSAFGGIFGFIWRILDRRHRTTAQKNLQMVFGDTKSQEEINRIIKGVFHNFMESAIECLQIPALTLEKIHEIIDTRDLKKLDKYLEAEKGVVLVASHFGNWELMAAAGAIAGYKVSAVARPFDDPDVDEIVREFRESSGLRIIPRRVSALAVVRSLKRNEIVGILADQNTTKQRIFVDFFGIKAATTNGPALLGLRTGAALVPTFMIREAPGKHRWVIEDPIDVVRTGDEEADIVATTQKYVDVLEHYVRKYPTQWNWIHRRWNTRPKGEPPLY